MSYSERGNFSPQVLKNKAYVQQEFEDYRSGIIPRISTNFELNKRLGFTGSATANAFIRAVGLNTERAKIVAEIRKVDPQFFRGKKRVSIARQIFDSYVADKAEKYKAQEIEVFPSDEQLGEEFGFTQSTVEAYLRGLRKDLRNSEKPNIKELMEPSFDLAWMVGFLAAGGYVHKFGIVFLNENEELLDEFRRRGERLFKISSNMSDSTGKRLKNGKKRIRVDFNSGEIAFALGDLRRKEWAKTLIDKYPWILLEQRFSWGFLQGYFETKGHIKLSSPNQVKINTVSLENANLIADILVRLDLHPTLLPDKRMKDGIGGVGLLKIDNMRVFSQNVHSCRLVQEQRLETLRDRYLRVRPSVYSEEEILLEWKKLVDIFGRSPTMTEIEKLRKEGKTRFYGSLYAKRFGDNRFKVAKENLENY